MKLLNSIVVNIHTSAFYPCLITVLLLTSFNVAQALEDDITKPVHINANSATFNKAKGFARYEGNVQIEQGTLKISAAVIEIKAPNNKITLITADGNPVKFEQKMDDGKLARGQANKVRYYVDNKRLQLIGNAQLSQNNDQFSSNSIEYSISNGELKAGTEKSPKSRVRAVFYPSNNK